MKKPPLKILDLSWAEKGKKKAHAEFSAWAFW